MEEPLSDILEKGEEQLKLQVPQGGTCSTDATIIMGATGSGKSTLAQVLGGSLCRLVATRQNGVPLIQDDTNLISHGCESKTFIPNYIVHPTENYAFWDCPGFEDNRGDKIDIASMYFLWRIFSLATQCKLLLTVDFANVSVGNRNNGFDQLLTHAIQMLTNISGWVNSLAIIVTKVPNLDQMTGEKFTDESIMKQIKEFFQGYLADKKQKVNQQSHETNENFQQRIMLVEEVLKQDKLSFVRLPTQEGSLAKDKTIENCMQNVIEVLTQRLTFKQILHSDIRISLRDTTVLAIRDTYLPDISEQVKSMMSEYIELLEQQLKNSRVLDPGQGENCLSQILKVSQHINKTLNSETNTTNDSPSDTIMFADLLEQLPISLTVDMTTFNFERLKDLCRQLQFFKDILNKRYNNDDTFIQHYQIWKAPLRVFLTKLERLKIFCEFCSSVSENLISRSSAYETIAYHFEIRRKEPEGILNFLKTSKKIDIPQEVHELWQTDGFEEPKKMLADIVKKTISDKAIFEGVRLGMTIIQDVTTPRLFSKLL